MIWQRCNLNFGIPLPHLISWVTFPENGKMSRRKNRFIPFKDQENVCFVSRKDLLAPPNGVDSNLLAPQGVSIRIYWHLQECRKELIGIPKGVSIRTYWHPQGVSIRTYWHPQGVSIRIYWHPQGVLIRTYEHPQKRVQNLAQEDVCSLFAASIQKKRHLYAEVAFYAQNASPRVGKVKLVAFFTFQHCASSNVSLNSLPEKRHNHIGCFFYFYPLCVFKCLFKQPACEDAKSHCLHLFDFSPLCIIKCFLKLPAREDT